MQDNWRQGLELSQQTEPGFHILHMEDCSIGQHIVLPEWVQITNALNSYHKLSISLVHAFHNANCPTFQVSLSSLSSLPTFSPSPCVWCASMSIIGPQFVHLNKPLWVVLPEHGKLFTKGFPLELAPSLTKGIPHLFTIPDQHWRRGTSATRVCTCACALCTFPRNGW